MLASKYYLIYKPFGMLSQFSKQQASDISLADLPFDFPRDVYPVGRLDKDSEGLLLLSNDKKLTDRLLNPIHKHNRTYWVQVEGIPDEKALNLLQDGPRIRINKKDYFCKPLTAQRINEPHGLPERVPPVRFRKHIPTCWLQLRLTEGKNRQVRKMTAAIGHPTWRLVRSSIEDLSLIEMIPGSVCQLEEKVLYKQLKLDKIG